MNPTTQVSLEVVAERNAQDTRWGEQNHPDHHVNVNLGLQNASEVYEIPSESRAKLLCEKRRYVGTMSWADILTEEFVEALNADTEESLRAELIQVAAVAQAWVECIDRRNDHDDEVDRQQNEAAGWPE
jgi:hypothetical protein